jgi:predicted anti-sigma-YlaC factor YlaD
MFEIKRLIQALALRLLPAAFLWFAASGCSLNRYALNKASDAISTSGSTFASDDDPELIKAAAPFSLKLMESLIAENPKHAGLLTALASGFTQYSFAFVQEDADELEAQDLKAADALRNRARRLYLRAQGYGLRGLEVNHPGFTNQLASDPQAAVRVAAKADVPLLYWTGAAWASAISLSKDNPAIVGQIPAMEALIMRALELDEDYDHGALQSFMITFEMSLPGAGKDAATRSRQRFDRAVALSKGVDASPYVALAEAVTIQTQDAKQFESLLNHALAINAAAHPEIRLANLVMQRRARWLLSRKSELFLTDDNEKNH